MNGVLRPKLLKTPLGSCFLINLDFLVPRISLFKTLGVTLFVFFLHCKQEDVVVLYLGF